ncbi:peptidoglycan-binding protein [Streptomyces sioyaensis]|uniref:peptidoglycan-binding domain-containing protein n=1 Tax=Streptomyces sioyaensis TaxID=67364 RepID=UPI0036C2A08C
MTARNCPHCSAPVRGDGRPACLCAAVGADDFDPLRVRPYVSLPDGEEDGERDAGADADAGGDTGSGYGRGHGTRGSRDDGGVDGAGPVHVEGPGAARTGRSTAGPCGSTTGPGDQLDDLPGVDAAVYSADTSASASFSATSVSSTPSARPSPTPLVPQARRRSGPTSRTFSATEGEPSAGPVGPSGPVPRPARPMPRRTRARPAALVATGAAAAVAAALIGTDALSGGVRDRAAPPDRSTASPSAALPTGDALTPSAAASSPAPDRSPSPDATATGPPPATVRHHRTTRPPRPPAPTRASGSVADSPYSPTPPSSPPTGPLVLREGAAGPEVAELQGRLRQLGLYPGAGSGRYDAEVRAAVARYQRLYGVTGDPDGVYGAGTRASLESRTAGP